MTTSEPDDADACSDDVPDAMSGPPRIARCGTCQRWLRVTEEELLASLVGPITCWACDTADGDPGSAGRSSS